MGPVLIASTEKTMPCVLLLLVLIKELSATDMFHNCEVSYILKR